MVIIYTIKLNIYGGIVCRWAKVPYVANITGLGSVFQNPGMLRKLVNYLYRFAPKKRKSFSLRMQKTADIHCIIFLTRLIHRRAVIGQNVSIGNGSVVMAGAVISPCC